jgi:transcriptional regulator with XRE-family HTH domain
MVMGMIKATNQPEMRRNKPCAGNIRPQARGPPFMSAIILPFVHQTRTPLKAKTSGSARKPFSSSALVIFRKCSDGIDPRARQLLTAGMPKPTNSAVANVPSSASTISSTDLSIPQHTSRSVKMSRVHSANVDSLEKMNSLNEMDSKETIGRRLDLWARTVKHFRGLTATAICDLIDCAENTFSQYRSAKRPLDVEVADALCDHYGLTLDWLYRGDMRLLDHDLKLQMKAIEEGKQESKKRTRRKA